MSGLVVGAGMHTVVVVRPPRGNRRWAAWLSPRIDHMRSPKIGGKMLDEELRGSCKDGYTPEKFQCIARSIQDATGIKLCCIWGYIDDWGYGGDSEFYLQDGDRLFELTGNLWPWLSAARG